MKLQKLVDAIEELELYCSLCTFTDCVWMDNGNTLSVNTEANALDLRGGVGATYAFEFSHYEQSEDGYFLYHFDNGCGDKDTIILKADEQVCVEEENE